MRYFLLTTLFLYISISSDAQTDDNSRWSIGVKAGASLSNLLFASPPHKLLCGCGNSNQGPTPYNYKPNLLTDIRAALATGISLDYHLSKRNSLSLEVNYEQKGIRLNDYKKTAQYNETDYATYDYTRKDHFKRIIKNNYLTVPLLFKRTFGKRQQFYFTSGIYTGLLLTSSGVAESSMEDRYVTISYTYPNSIRPPKYFSNYTSINNMRGKDEKREFTTHIDLGLVGALASTFHWLTTSDWCWMPG